MAFIFIRNVANITMSSLLLFNISCDCNNICLHNLYLWLRLYLLIPQEFKKQGSTILKNYKNKTTKY